MVHIRFCGLGIPESKWGDLLEEAARVLVKGGTLEIVEMAYTPPIDSPLSVKNSFASILLADLIQPDTILPLRFNLPATTSLVPLYQPVFESTWKDRVMSRAVIGWIRSTLEYKGTGIGKDDSGAVYLRELGKMDEKWRKSEKGEDEIGEATIWVWVVKRL